MEDRKEEYLSSLARLILHLRRPQLRTQEYRQQQQRIAVFHCTVAIPLKHGRHFQLGLI